MKKIKKINQQNNVDGILFKCGGSTKKVRKKAFWGALIGAGVSAIGNIINSVINSNKQQDIAMQNYKQQKELMDKLDAQNKQNAENEYYNKINSNINVYDDFKKSLLAAKMGGKFKKCRKKAEWGASDTGNLISSILGVGSNITSNIIDANAQLKNNELALAAAGRIGKQYNYVTPNFNNIRETINERNSIYNGQQNELIKRRRGQLNSLYLS